MKVPVFINVAYTYFIYNMYAFFNNRNLELGIKTMNLGFQSNHAKKINLLPEDQDEYLQFQLYDYLISKIDINSKSIIEIGCGSGGGCYYTHTYYRPKSITGIDLIEANIQIAKKRYAHLSIEFEQGDACSLLTQSESKEVVLNLESSHCYSNFDKFIQEVYRILLPGGYFLFADLRYDGQEQALNEIFAKYKFETIHFEDISSEVIYALNLDNERKLKGFEKAGIAKHIFKYFGFMKGTRYYRLMHEGKLKYFLYVLKKPKF